MCTNGPITTEDFTEELAVSNPIQLHLKQQSLYKVLYRRHNKQIKTKCNTTKHITIEHEYKCQSGLNAF